jgi:hypothetical protein
MKLSFSFLLLDVGQSAGLIGRVISSSQGLCVPAPVIVRMEKLVETEVLWENLPRRYSVHHKTHLPDPGANPGRCGGKPATNRFNYGAARGYLCLTKTSVKLLPVVLVAELNLWVVEYDTSRLENAARFVEAVRWVGSCKTAKEITCSMQPAGWWILKRRKEWDNEWNEGNC